MKRISALLLAAALLAGTSASAQSFRSGYFLDNYVYGYRINPAQVSNRSFFGLALDNIDLQHGSSMGVSSFLYPNPDGSKSLVTGLNKAISTETFIKGLKNHNFISVDESINVLTVGIANGRRMHTVELNARVSAAASIPRSVFTLLKSGRSGTYDFNSLYGDATALADLCYGYSTTISDKLSVGGRLHLLLGLANVNLRSNGTSVTMDEKSIIAGAQMELNASGMLRFATDSEGSVDMSSVEFNPDPLGNYGAALDLGAEYKFDFGLDAMVSITDLGAVSWENKMHAYANGNVEFNGLFGEGGTVKTDIEDLLDLNNALDYRVVEGHRRMRMLPFNFAAGARYYMPFYKGLSVGMLHSCHFARSSSWYEMRMGVTFTPARILSLSGNLGVGTFGSSWGTALNLHLGPFNLLAGVDSYLGRMGKYQKIPFPVNSFVENAHVGLILTFK